MRIAARDLAGRRLEDVVAEISAVAEACLEAAVREVAPDLRLAVIGLGKLGGAELNYSSDVDLLFLHEGDAAALAERAAARLIALLSDPTAEGIALRVDPTLRPGGRSGLLARSLEATLVYYERESAVWERQAMIKARHVARRPVARRAVRGGPGPARVPGRAAARRDRRGPPDEGPAGGVHPRAAARSSPR